jgi:L-histidine N-alpha-methyltransferase
VTAAFNRNVLSVLNTELGADFDLDRFDHVARYDARCERIEMWLRANRDQLVHVKALDLDVPFAAGEQMRTEISTKFRRTGVEMELATGDFEMVRWWTDPAGDFAVSLSRAVS